MLLCQQTHKTHSNYLLVAFESTFIPKVIDCMHQTIKTYPERKHIIPLPVTHTLYVYQVCHSVGRCVKDGSCSHQAWSESQWIVLMGYLRSLWCAGVQCTCPGERRGNGWSVRVCVTCRV